MSSRANVGQNLARKIVGKLLRQRRPEFGLDSAHDRIEPQPQETIARLLVAQVKARLAEPAAGHGERDHLAVDEHAVAIENDDLGPAGFQGRSRISRSAWRRISCARRFRAWNAANAPPAGAARSAIADIDPIAEIKRLRPRRYGADHRRAEQHRLRRLRRLDRLAAHVGDDLADQRAPRRAAADDDRIEFVTGPLELADDVGEAIGKTAETGDMELLQARGVFAQVHPQDAAARSRIRQRRSAADEVGQDMQPLGDQRRRRQTAGAGDNVLLERRKRMRPRARRSAANAG